MPSKGAGEQGRARARPEQPERPAAAAKLAGRKHLGIDEGGVEPSANGRRIRIRPAREVNQIIGRLVGRRAHKGPPAVSVVKT